MAEESKFYEPVDGMKMPRFSGMPTFMRLPHITDFNAVDIALTGVPWDGGTTNRAGARHGNLIEAGAGDETEIGRNQRQHARR